MNEMIKFWLTDMYEREIEGINGTILNNRLCILSAANEEEEHMFIQNELDMKEYLEVLEELKMEIE